MKALTLHQPWAQLIALGVKTIETRTKPTKYRGELLIHAGAAEPPSGYQYGDYEVPGLQMFHNGGYVPKMVRLTDYTDIPLPLGAIVASCKLVDCVPVEKIEWVRADWNNNLTWWKCASRYPVLYALTKQQPYGDFTPGRFAWLLEDIQPVEKRCPACLAFERTELDRVDCVVCEGYGRTDPIPAKGKQGLWEWTP